MSKAELRDTLLPQLRQLTVAAVATASARVQQRLQELLATMKAPMLIGYAATEWELRVDGALTAWRQAGGLTGAPRACAGGYEIAAAPPLDGWQPGRFGILEPPSTAERVSDAITRTAAWLVPGIAFTSNGTRLGRGGGFYDRLLADSTGLRIGVAHHFQVVDDIPSAAHDIHMDIIVTDRQAVVVNHEKLTTATHKG